MNQILYIDKSKRKKTVEIKKVIKFFGISLIAFGVVMIGHGTYAKIKNLE